MEKEIIFKNHLDEVTRIATFIETISEELELNLALVSSLQLAIEEAIVNVIEYAYPKGTEGEASLSIHHTDNVLTFTLADSGTPFDPTAKADADTTLSVEERPIGGLGILLIKKIMNEVDYRYENGKNILIMKKGL